MHGARARAGSAWAGGGGAGAVRAECSKAPRSAASSRTRGGGRGEGIKGAGFPLPDPPFLPRHPHAVKGLDSRASPLARIICPPERKYAPHPPYFTLPLLFASGSRGPSARARQGPRARPRPRLLAPPLPRSSASPLAPPAPRSPPIPASARALGAAQSARPPALRRGVAPAQLRGLGPPPRASDLLVAYGSLDHCCPRVHPLLNMCTVPQDTLPDFSKSSEASVHCHPTDLKENFTFHKAW